MDKLNPAQQIERPLPRHQINCPRQKRQSIMCHLWRPGEIMVAATLLLALLIIGIPHEIRAGAPEDIQDNSKISENFYNPIPDSSSVPPAVQSKRAKKLPDDDVSGILELVDQEFLTHELQTESTASRTNSIGSTPMPEEISDSNSLDAFAKSAKNRRQISENQHKLVDWWMKLKGPSQTAAPKVAKGTRAHGSDRAEVYKEQPLDQNPILTGRNQILAIRGKYRQLMKSSVDQLQQLDEKLIKSYKFCLKRKAPLYAGMLYRTRDHVNRLDRDLKQERLVLEALANQVQKVVRQKMTNKTLVREYNKLVESATTTTRPLTLVALDKSKPVDRSKSWFLTAKLDDSVNSLVDSPTSSMTAATDSRLKQRARNGKFPKEPNRDDHHDIDSPRQKNPLVGQSEPESKRHDNDVVHRNVAKPPKLKQTYTVHINEVKLRKELIKSQSLIDRIDSSCTQLTSVIDDIMYMFKLEKLKKGLTSSGRTNKLEMMHDNIQPGATDMTRIIQDQKFIKRMLKPPVKVFLEKFGRLSMFNPEHPNLTTTTSTTTASGTSSAATTAVSNIEINMNNLPELKPLFEPDTIIHKDLIMDHELGFDTGVTISAL